MISGRGFFQGQTFVLRITEGLPKIVLIELSTQPANDVVLTFSSAEPKEPPLESGLMVSVSPSTLTITPTNWNTPQEVEVIVTENNRELARCDAPDQIYPDVHSSQVEFSISSSDNAYSSPKLVVFTYDNDNPNCNSEDYEHEVPVGITVPSTAMVTEGSSTTVDVKLAAEPKTNVTVTFSDDGDSDVSWSGTTLSGDVLTFAPWNWETAQTVTLTAAEDEDYAHGVEDLTLTASSGGGYYGVTANIAVTIVDDDIEGAGITVPGAAAAPEGSTTTVEVNWRQCRRMM